MAIMFDLLNWLISVTVEIAITGLLSLERTVVIFEDTSVNTADDQLLSLFIFTISRNGAFFIRFALIAPFAASPIALKCLSKTGLGK